LHADHETLLYQAHSSLQLAPPVNEFWRKLQISRHFLALQNDAFAPHEWNRIGFHEAHGRAQGHRREVTQGPGWPTDTLLFASNRSSNYELFSIRPDGSHWQQLTREAASTWLMNAMDRMFGCY
jgi:hypothetical protein